jgi:hypothetical protein
MIVAREIPEQLSSPLVARDMGKAGLGGVNALRALWLNLATRRVVLAVLANFPYPTHLHARHVQQEPTVFQLHPRVHSAQP